MKHELIGRINHGIDGSDFYYLLTLDEEDDPNTTPDQALSYVESVFYLRSHETCKRPGGRFCRSVLVSPKQWSDTEFIGIAQVRFDV